jgi:hypothetical protein
MLAEGGLAREGEEEAEGKQQQEKKEAAAEAAGGAPPRKELARGVAAFPPLNVPNLPGTGDMQLEVNHHEFQTAQGNGPRAVMDDQRPGAGMVDQLVRSFDSAQAQAARDPGASVASAAPLPHSVPLTTGNPLADPTLPAPLNTPGLQPVVQPAAGVFAQTGLGPAPNPFQLPPPRWNSNNPSEAPQ